MQSCMAAERETLATQRHATLLARQRRCDLPTPSEESVGLPRLCFGRTEVALMNLLLLLPLPPHRRQLCAHLGLFF